MRRSRPVPRLLVAAAVLGVVVLGVVVLGAVVLGAAVLALAPMGSDVWADDGTAAESSAAAADRQIVWKQRHIGRTVTELRKRAPAGLSPAQQIARAAAIERLAAYGTRGVFPIDAVHPGLAIPYLIDQYGTRCALAHLVDQSGHVDLLRDLARTHNNAFVPELIEDARLIVWLRDNGLSADDAALIQAPGYVDPAMVDPTGDANDSDLAGRRARRRRTATPGAGISWEQWWNLNRHAFHNVREAYHRVVVTGARDGDTARPYRPSDSGIHKILLPLFQEQARTDSDTRATALMSWARAVRGKDATEAVQAVLTYLRGKDATYRKLVILALGLSGHTSAYDPLVGMVRDTKVGRAHLRTTQALDDRSRAFAAIALGELGDPRAIPELLHVLANEQGHAADLRSCCVAALGALSTKGGDLERARIQKALLTALDNKTWSQEVLATIPAALVISRDAMAPKLVEHLAQFRKPSAARQSAALALPLSELKLNESLANTLIGTTRRDPDDMARRFALVSLGELASTLEPKDDAVQSKLRVFYEAGFKGTHIKSGDRPWLYLSSAFFARAFPKNATAIAAHLMHIVRKGSAREHRAAAAVASAITGDAKAVPELRRLLAKSGDDRLRGFLAESLGILRDRESSDTLLKLVRDDSSDHVRYHAAYGLGFLADRDLVPSLVDALRTCKSFTVKAALTRVIGEIGDRKSLLPLMKMARDPKADTWTRRRALAALGMIGEASDQSWTARFRRGANLIWATPTLREVLSIF